MERNIEFESGGGRFGGYLAPPPSGEGPAVVLLPAWLAFNGHSVDVAHRLARQGFSAFIPDLHAPDEPPERPDAIEGFGDLARVAAIVADGVREVASSRIVTGDGLGLLGFGYGAAVSLWVATLSEAVAATVCAYGHVPASDPEPDFAAAGSEFQLHFAGVDEWTSPAEAGALELTLSRAGKRYERHDYPEGKYPFFDETSPAYHEQAAAHLWRRSLGFLGGHLGL